MRNPDLICIWPKHLDYPPFRLFIRLYRSFFSKVIVVFTDMHSFWDFTEEVMTHMQFDGVTFEFSYPAIGDDWRNAATNQGLYKSDSPWVLFMEQDFFIKSHKDLEHIWSRREFFNVIGFEEGKRLHPAFLLASRKSIDKTSKDFSAKPPEYDHFGKFTNELDSKEVCLLDEIEIKKNIGYQHMNGLSHNIYLASTNNVENIYKREEFIKYLKSSTTNIEVSDKYKMLLELCLKNLGEKL